MYVLHLEKHKIQEIKTIISTLKNRPTINNSNFLQSLQFQTSAPSLKLKVKGVLQDILSFALVAFVLAKTIFVMGIGSAHLEKMRL